MKYSKGLVKRFSKINKFRIDPPLIKEICAFLSIYQLPRIKPVESYSDFELTVLCAGLIAVAHGKKLNREDPVSRANSAMFTKVVDYVFSTKAPVFHITKDLFLALWHTKTKLSLLDAPVVLPAFSVFIPDGTAAELAYPEIEFKKEISRKTKVMSSLLCVTHLNAEFDQYYSNCMDTQTSFNYLDHVKGGISTINWSNFSPLIGEGVIGEPTTGGYSTDSDSEPFAMNNFILNLILYLQNYQEKITIDSSSTGFGGRAKKLKAKEIGQGYSPIKWIGKGYKITRDYTGTGTHSSPKMHMRMGHWRKQPVGSREKKSHKMIWIEPTLVNVN